MSHDLSGVRAQRVKLCARAMRVQQNQIGRDGFGQQQGLFADTATQHMRVCLDTDRVPNGAEFVMSAFRRCFQAVCGHVGFNIAEIPVGQHIGQVYPPLSGNSAAA